MGANLDRIPYAKRFVSYRDPSHSVRRLDNSPGSTPVRAKIRNLEIFGSMCPEIDLGLSDCDFRANLTIDLGGQD